MNQLNHVAIIMDGNGRWGLNKNKSRNYGHLKGLKTAEIIIKESIEYIESIESISTKIKKNTLSKKVALYYEKANEHAIKLYKSMYGNAYPLVLTASVIPREHYFLYTGMARAYLESGNPERAIKATKWNLNIWPQSVENYITAAEGFEQIGNHRRACRILRTARELGYLGDVSFECD